MNNCTFDIKFSCSIRCYGVLIVFVVIWANP